jgi:hypothetical protein
MKLLFQCRHAVAIAAVAAGALLPTLATAQAMPAGAAPGPWRYGATIYGYLPTIGGTTTFPADASGTGINVSGDQIIDGLKFAFMGSFDAHNGRWGVFTDVMYLDIGGSKSNSRDFSIGSIGIPAGTSADLDLDLKGWVWTLAGEYRVMSSPAATMDVLAGARMFDLKERLNWSIYGNLGPIAAPGRNGSSEISDTVWDAIIGVKGRYAFGPNREWLVPYYLDVGTGESKLTWQGAIGLGYAFKWGDVVAMWRYLGYEFKSGSRVEDMNFNGPMIGATFRW